MRRVLLIFILVAFALIVVLASTSFAGNRAASYGLCHDNATGRLAPSEKDTSGDTKTAWVGSWRMVVASLFGSIKLPVLGVIIDVPAIEQDGPLTVQTPPGPGSPKKELPAEKRDNPWEDQK